MFGSFLYRLGILAMIAGATVFACQCLAWAKLGYWTPLSVNDVLAEFGVADLELRQSMIGIQKVIDLLTPVVLGFPISLVLILLGSLIVGTAERCFPPSPRKPLP